MNKSGKEFFLFSSCSLPSPLEHRSAKGRELLKINCRRQYTNSVKTSSISLKVVFLAGISLEFDGLRSSDKWIEIKENSYINLTANLQWTPGCERNNEDKIQLKISHPEGSFSIDVCKLILTTNCDESDTSNATSVCRCLNKSSVQFYKKVSRFDSRNYTWTVVNLINPGAEKRREIFISVSKYDACESKQQ